MPAYNVEEFITDSINSILSQSYTKFELLISDDASVDNTLNIAVFLSKKDKRIKVFSQVQNLGFVGNKNFLLSKAKGSYIAWQDSDDISFPDRLKLQLEAMN